MVNSNFSFTCGNKLVIRYDFSSTKTSLFNMAHIQVSQKTVVVTGGGSGIGYEIVKKLWETNNVICVDCHQESLEKVKSVFPTVQTIAVDLSDWDKTKDTLDKELPDVVHGLVNNAGIGDQCGFLNFDPESFDRVISVNVRAILNVSQIVAKRIIAHNGNGGNVIGSIVNISSLASRFPTRISLPYNLSKAAVDMLTKSMALEFGPQNIRVNSVNPNIVDTPLARAWIEARGNTLGEKLMARTPLGKFVDIQDVVNTVIFLLSDAVYMIHGESIFVDGGYCVT